METAPPRLPPSRSEAPACPTHADQKGRIVPRAYGQIDTKGPWSGSFFCALLAWGGVPTRVRRAAGFLRAGTSAGIGGLGSTVASAVVGVGFSATVLRTLDELSTNKHIVRASETDANGRAR